MQIDDFDVKCFPSIQSIGLSQTDKTLRVCIVTEEIIGPVRNGGIASTYYHLSKGLAAQGHDVHVLFLKGPIVQDETPEHWVEHFADFGVTLHYLEIPDRPLWAAAAKWQERFVAAYNWLRDAETFDVVHTSEWRGGMVYALMAKRLGLAFQETLFLVKTSSPHIWNRHYQMLPIEHSELVLAAYAEQKCVELADVVIGGSAHLITFMEHIGYRVPDENVFVQPNIVDFSKVIVTDERPPRKPGDLVKTRELIFFGRLEGRKGVELMCNALDLLKERGIAPERMTFMGKWGAPLATQGGMAVEDYLKQKSKNWDFPVEYITDKNQPAALSHMCSRDMIAIMPSLIENSTMAVYETLENNIPFIATRTGGTPELIDESDHARCLVEPEATSLADQVQRALEEGQVIAHPSFSNDENLRVWYDFHGHLAQQIHDNGRLKAIGDIASKVDVTGPSVATLSYVVLVRCGEDLRAMTAALKASKPDRVVIGLNDAAMRDAVQEASEALTAAGLTADVVELIGRSAGDALNSLAARNQSDGLIMAHGSTVFPKPGFFEAAKTALTMRPHCLFTSFFAAQTTLGTPIGGDVASQFLNARAFGPELFAMTQATYKRLGPFERYDVQQGLLHEYVTRAVETGPDDLLVCPEDLILWPAALSEAPAFFDNALYSYLKAKPLIDRSSLSMRKIILANLQQSRGTSVRKTFGDAELRDGARKQDAPLWLMPTDWDRNGAEAAQNRFVVAALDEANNTLWLYARGAGERKLFVRSAAQQLTQLETHGQEGADDYITLHTFKIPDAWDAERSYPISFELHAGDERLRNLFIRVNKITPSTYALSSRHPLMTYKALKDLIALRLNKSKPVTPRLTPAAPSPELTNGAAKHPQQQTHPETAARPADAPSNSIARFKQAISERLK